ncbi:MAG: penicillin-binding protein 2, partial [Pseudomonadota bacterium]|nr:penicillin-binding protein 2 [Pseudomonadota bacterium]
NLPVWSLFAHPQEMVDPDNAAEKLAVVFPDLNADDLKARFKDGRRFLWIKKSITPAERIRVHDIGDPGLQFGRREVRVYPGGRLAAHVLGGASFGREDVRAAEIVGVGGVEAKLDAELRDPARAGAPLRLSLDLRVQRAMADVLREGMARYTAKGAAGVLMDAKTGEVLSLVSLPDFDPNERPIPFGNVKAGDFPTFNRAAQGLYELGSTFKIFTAAMMLEAGLANARTMVDTTGPMKWRRFTISDSHRMPPRMSLREVIVESSNVGTARLALQAGAHRQKDLLRRLGLLDPLPVELSEAGRAAPLYPSNWSEISVITISYGHGLSASPLHLAAAYATMVNGGLKVEPTLVAGAKAPGEEARVISEATSLAMRDMLRGVVTDGTGRNADVPGYFIGGKTGTAEKASGGGYASNRVVATFAGAFPMQDPRYVIVVTYDEAVAQTKWGPRRPAGWTAAPTVKEAVTRIAPILGMRPMLEAEAPEDVGVAGGQVASR